ncbi:MAG TPA: GWxTD domain-containing protein [Gemmatimonadaceae bacterium]|nr:GWxTD domain-containing protein [Gemmatimonadaceae bacterium]
MPPLPSSLLRPAALLLLAMPIACGGGRRGEAPGSPPRPSADRNAPAPPDPIQLYRRMGLIAHGGPFPVTGRVSYMAGPSVDTTFAILTLALPNRALSFSHTGEDYRATYAVDIAVRRAGETTTTAPPVAHHTAQESVRVPSFRETTRTDESVLFQQVMRLAPGSYRLVLHLRDGGSDRAVDDTTTLTVPRLATGTLATPIPYYEAVVRTTLADVPRVLVTPRATVTFGRDSVMPLYLEAYGDGATPVVAAARGDGGAVLWRDTLTLQARDGGRLASGVLQVPVAYLGIGASTVAVWRPGVGDTTRAPLFVSFGDDLPAATFEDMLSYLRFFTAPARLDTLREAAVADRPRVWREFLAATDPDPDEPGNQALQQYFTRIQVANQRYREEAGPGWLSDRGMVYAAFGDPDQIYESAPGSVGQRNRFQIWMYRERSLQLEFRDRTGFDRWELTPQAEGQFYSALRRLP